MAGCCKAGMKTTFAIPGRVQGVSQSFISQGATGGGGGVNPLRAFNFTGWLTGTGTVAIINSGTTLPQQVTGGTNTFSGQWLVQCGWLFGGAAGTNSLGTNNITIDPLYNGYLLTMT